MLPGRRQILTLLIGGRNVTLLLFSTFSFLTILPSYSHSDILQLRNGTILECVLVMKSSEIYALKVFDIDTCRIITDSIPTQDIFACKDNREDHILLKQWREIISEGCPTPPTMQKIGQWYPKPLNSSILSEEQEKEIWTHMRLIDRYAHQEAERADPTDYSVSLIDQIRLKEGESLVLKERVALMPELHPRDYAAATLKVISLQPGTTIKVLRRAFPDNSYTAWYFVVASSNSRPFIGSGWINSNALWLQLLNDGGEEYKKRDELKEKLTRQYADEFLRKTGLTEERATQIWDKGWEENWPAPPDEEPPDEEPQAEVSPSWREVATWKGKATKRTDLFHVPAAEWRITWKTKTQPFAPGFFSVTIYDANGEYIGLVANILEEDSDSSYMYGSGSFYLDINSTQNYTITVEARY